MLKSFSGNGILYVPDYIANSGGVINVAAEIGQIYDRQNVKTRVGSLNEKLRQVLEIADNQSITPLAAANMLAEARLQGRLSIREVRGTESAATRKLFGSGSA